MSSLRYPAVPLITNDPYLSVWSCTDRLYDDVTRHWTRSRQSLIGIVSSGGRSYRFMGSLSQDNFYADRIPVIPQTDVKVYPMHTVYTFENEVIRLEVTFMSPLLLSDLYLLSRPVSYISYRVIPLNGKDTDVSVYIGVSAELAVNTPDQSVKIFKTENGMMCGRGEEGILALSGDDRRIDWGYLHVFSRPGKKCGAAHINTIALRLDRRHPEELGDNEYDDGTEVKISDTFAHIGFQDDFTAKAGGKGGFICVGYDDIHSLTYLGRPIDAYYRKNGDTFEDICKKALDEYEDICSRVAQAEEELLQSARRFGEKYADIISLAYRQTIAAHKLAFCGDEIFFVSKECFSNGCAATLDVTYPSIPLYLIYAPELVEGMLNPIFGFADTPRWPFDFAPHDVGQYPRLNGQVYGLNREKDEFSDESQMPVEESGNAIICTYAACRAKGDYSYFEKHRECLLKWAQYLIKYGTDPENQLCTDDFAGHLAHNCNLSAKAIVGIAAFGKMLEAIGEEERAKSYLETAREYAKSWKRRARSGDHYRLAFDKPDSWSIKYNLVWDKILGLDIFDGDIFEDEVSFYKTKFNRFGLPLDMRSDYTKSDWLMWSTCLCEDKDYEKAIIDTMWDMLDNTPSRVPFTDWYYTSTAMQVGFQNRTVQGGLFIKLLSL